MEGLKQQIPVLLLSITLTVVALLYIYDKKTNSIAPGNEALPTFTPAPETRLEDNKFVSPVLTNESNNEEFRFSLQIPKDWTVIQYEKDDRGTYDLRLSKNNHTFHIWYPEGFSPTICSFDRSDELGQTTFYPYFSELDTEFGVVRMARFDLDFYQQNSEVYNGVSFDGCQLNEYMVWSTATKIGLIAFGTPDDYSEETVGEMENILQKVNVTDIH